MSWFFAEIGLSLLLAALVGWFVGWYLRAFRDQDTVEDLRQTMAVTKDVKDRELNELRRKVEDLGTRLTRASDDGARAAGSAGPTSTPAVEVAPLPTPPAGELAEAAEFARVAAAERELRRDAEAALARKTEAMITVQADIVALRVAVREKTAMIDQLQGRLVRKEQASWETGSTDGERARLEARLRALDRERASAVDPSTVLDELRRKMESLETRVERAPEPEPESAAGAAPLVDVAVPPAGMVTLQAEIEALREAVAEKAAEIVRLQDRLVETEPAGRQLESKYGEVASLEARLRALDEERSAALAAATAAVAELEESRKEVVIRDTRINDLRNRCASLETELTGARASSPAKPHGDEALARLERSLEDARHALQRQIDRNRKQESVHRAVVEQLKDDKERLRHVGAEPAADRP